MKILGFPEDVTRLERKERRKFYKAAAAFGMALAEESGIAERHSPRLVGEMFAFTQLMGRGPREEEMGDLYEIATAEYQPPA